MAVLCGRGDDLHGNIRVARANGLCDGMHVDRGRLVEQYESDLAIHVTWLSTVNGSAVPLAAATLCRAQSASLRRARVFGAACAATCRRSRAANVVAWISSSGAEALTSAAALAVPTGRTSGIVPP